MGIIATDAEHRRQVAQDLALKLRLEAQLEPQLNGFFRQVRKDFIVFYSHAAHIPDFKEFHEPDLVALLKRHYRKVFRIFGNRLRDQVAKALLIEMTKSKETDAVDAELARLVAERADGQASFILTTTRSDLMAALQAVLAKAHANGNTLSQAEIAGQVAKAVKPGQLSRAATIAMTETNGAAELAKWTEASTFAEMGVAVAGVSLTTDVVKHWDATLDEKTRLWHAVADGQRRQIDDPFDVNGEQLMVPGDGSLGASPENLINCVVPSSKISIKQMRAATRNFYNGEIITIELTDGTQLTVTPNHPILTDRGWVRASQINELNHVVHGRFFKDLVLKHFNINHVVPTAQDLFDTLNVSRVAMRVPAISVNFHGDIPNQDVDIVRVESKLMYTRGVVFNSFDKFFFKFSHSIRKFLVGFCSGLSYRFKKFSRLISNSLMSSSSHMTSLLSCHLTPFQSLSLTLSPRCNSMIEQGISNGSPSITSVFRDPVDRPIFLKKRDRFFTNLFSKFNTLFNNYRCRFPEFIPSVSKFPVDLPVRKADNLADFLDRFPGKIDLIKVIGVHRNSYQGYVYNFESKSQYYTCNGVVNHNCRCGSSYVLGTPTVL